MNRRGFLRTLAGGAAAAVAVRTFPFRVYSFPSIEPIRWYASDWGYSGVHAFSDVWILHPDQVRAFKDLGVKIEDEFYTDSIAGIRYIQSDVVGTFQGLERSKYPTSLTVTDVDHDEKTIFFAPQRIPMTIHKKAELALGDTFKEEDLVFRSIADRWRDFRNSLKRA